jgi:tRNA1Val (adenine37-N6)-methyltransferase
MDFDAQTETLDAILSGALSIVQPISGYRFSIDSILLGDFAQPGQRAHILELGAGCGVISAMVAKFRNPSSVVAIEIQPRLAALATRNAKLNGLENLQVIEGDLRAGKIQGVALDFFDYVLANPPYRAPLAGRESPNASRRLARGTGSAELRDFIIAAARHTRGGGRVAIIFTAVRTAELIALMKSHSLEPKRLRFVHSFADSPAISVLVEARKSARIEAKVESPLILWRRPGEYTAEALAILNGRKPPSA